MAERSLRSPVTSETGCIPTMKVWGSLIWSSAAFHTAGLRFHLSAGLSDQPEERLGSSNLKASVAGVKKLDPPSAPASSGQGQHSTCCGGFPQPVTAGTQ